MRADKKEKITQIATGAVRTGLLVIFTCTLLIMIVALMDTDTTGEAPIGSFGTKDFNEGWTLTFKGDSRTVNLPLYVDSEKGDELVISNTLPNNVVNGMSLMVRASMEDVAIYIDGKHRAEYSTNSIEGMCYYIPSAYVVTNLNGRDAGKQVDIHITIKNKGSINPVMIGHGNNGWFRVIRNGLAVNFIALVAFISGVILALTALILGRRYRLVAAGYLGILVMDITAWIFSESILRQLIFTRPSLSQYFSYITLELIGALVCMYFDAVQHGYYHKRYVLFESIMLIQVVINIVLHYTGVCEMFRTVTIMHAMEGISAILVFVNVITDYRTGRIKSYKISILGGVFFIVLSLFELAGFYLSEFVIFGKYMCIGLIGLMAATIIQTFYDVVNEYRSHEAQRVAMTNNTLETIAGAIDARDEYTGGHSERVGLYAGILAREIADKYGLSEEDTLRIHYIGLIHDIGKIGVADNVLNKSGKLTDEEFSLMKRHTEIGYEIMRSLGSEIEGILDGIRFHHERYDGSGYPDGLAGEDIPLVARILALADSFDAMTSNRVYRKRLTDEEVRSELVNCAGTQFDPDLSKVFVELFDRGELSADIEEGIATDAAGHIRSSALLEDKLQSDLQNGVRIIHASHVRMLCYIIKLMENNGANFSVLMFTAASDDRASVGKLERAIKGLVSRHDVNIKYTADSNIVALYGRSENETEEFISSVSGKCPDAKINTI